MSVPIPSADLSQPDAGGALAGWEQPAAVTSRSHVPHAFTPAPTEAVASESPPPVEPLSDTELLSAFVQRRDADAFTEIVQRYRLLVYRVALRAVDNRHLADDVFQATFLVLAQSADKIKRTEALAAWLHGTTRNIARRALGNQYAEQKQLKDWAKQTLAQKGEEMATSTEADPFEELARRHEQQLLDEELQQLPESSRAPLVLFYLEKKTQAEIAQIMGLSVDAVEGRLKRAKQELRTRLIRRGVLLSTVVAAATVLTPSITLAAPAASLVSTTVTTALGTAALGSTALGATAVTGAATSSKLAAGSATASTLAAQEIALMSITSKATAMLITSVASTTLISGLVLGAMVGTISMGAGGSVPPDELSLAEMAIPQEINDEALRPNLLSLEGDDLVQIALVEPEVTKESEEPASAPAEKVDENPNELKPFVYYVGDLTADDLLGAEDFAQSLGFSVLERRSKHFIVVHATTENNRKLADHFREIRQKRDAKMSLQFELLSARAKLTKLLKEFDESHPDVKQARSEIAALEKSIADQSPGAVPSEKVKNDSVQSTAQTETSDLSNRLGITSFDVGDLSAEELLDVGEYAMSVADLREVRTSTQSIIVSGALGDTHKISKYIEELRNKRPSQVRDRFKPLSDRLKLAQQLKEFEEYHPDLKQAREEISSMKKSIAEGTPGSNKADAQSTFPERGADPETTENITVTYSLADCISPKLTLDLAKDVRKFAELVLYDPPTRSLVVKATRGNHRRIKDLIFWNRESHGYAWDPQFELVWLKKRLSEKQRELGDDAAEVNSLRAQVESVEKKIAAQPPEERVQHLVEMSRQIEQQNIDIERLRQQLNEMEGSGVTPSKGLVAHVDPSKRTVWLHIGRRSNLQEQTTFSVADKSLAGVIRGTQDLKAKIEVVESYYEGAVARIVEEDPKRPIQAGDSIFSPIWSERGTTEFAFIGNGDLNGDLVKDDKDRQMLRAVVGNARGEITLEVNDEGARVPADAKITAQTKWLVVGDLGNPSKGANDPAALARLLAIHKQHEDLILEAREHGVKVASLKDFLAYIGWKPVIPHIQGFLPSAISLQLGEERLLTGMTFNLGDLVSAVSDRPDLVQVVDKTIIRAVQDGTANITVTDVNGKTATTQVEVPRQYIRSVSLLRNLTPVEKTIYEVLSRQEQLEFPQQTLDQFAESLSAKYQIPVKVDWQALEAAGVAKSATVSLSGLKRVEHALTDILSDVGAQRLEFFVDNGELHFTTQEAMRTTTRVREYDLSSLGEGHLNYDLPFPGDGELDFALQYADSLSQEITRQGKVLSFNAPLSNHKKFERFLAMLPELLKEPISTNASPVPKLSIEGDEASVSGIANQAKDAITEKVQVSLSVFATDDESIKLLATKGQKGFILKPGFRKNLESLLASGKAQRFTDQSFITRIGQPIDALSGWEFSIPSAESESQMPNAMKHGIETQVSVFNKRGKTGQRVLKYNLEVTSINTNNAIKIDDADFHSVSGKVMRGYAEISGTGTDEILLGPMDTGETRSPDGVMRKVSIYLRILVEYE